MPRVAAKVKIALPVSSVPLPDTIMPGLPRRAIGRPRSRATRCREIDVSGSAARQSRVASSTTFRMRNRRPQASRSWTKSSDQRALGRASTGIGARVPMALRRARPALPLGRAGRCGRSRTPLSPGAAARTGAYTRTGDVHLPDSAAADAAPPPVAGTTDTGPSCGPPRRSGGPAAPTDPTGSANARRLHA